MIVAPCNTVSSGNRQLIFIVLVPRSRDRRSLRGDTPAGVLVGHTEGLTYVASKGDGRYCVSNGKDQSMKLWDLRYVCACIF